MNNNVGYHFYHPKASFTKLAEFLVKSTKT